MLEVVGPRAVAAPVALSLRIMDLASEAVDDNAQVCGLLRFRGICHVELDKPPKLIKETNEEVQKKLL